MTFVLFSYDETPQEMADPLLNGLDLAFACLERPTTPRHMGAVLVFDPPRALHPARVAICANGPRPSRGCEPAFRKHGCPRAARRGRLTRTSGSNSISTRTTCLAQAVLSTWRTLSPCGWPSRCHEADRHGSSRWSAGSAGDDLPCWSKSTTRWPMASARSPCSGRYWTIPRTPSQQTHRSKRKHCPTASSRPRPRSRGGAHKPPRSRCRWPPSSGHTASSRP
jgi:hypothetical protein